MEKKPKPENNIILSNCLPYLLLALTFSRLNFDQKYKSMT